MPHSHWEKIVPFLPNDLKTLMLNPTPGAEIIIGHGHYSTKIRVELALKGYLVLQKTAVSNEDGTYIELILQDTVPVDKRLDFCDFAVQELINIIYQNDQCYNPYRGMFMFNQCYVARDHCFDWILDTFMHNLTQIEVPVPTPNAL